MARFRATPYAKALYDVVLDQRPDAAEEVLDELDRVATAVQTVSEFLPAMVTPMVPPETKTAILDAVLDKLSVKEPTRRFLHVVQRHYRLEHIARIRDAYRQIIDRALGRVRASIEVPATPDAATRERIVAAVAGVVDSTVIAEFTENPELLAGFRIQVGSKVFDGSLIGQLDQLRRQTLIEQG